MKTRMAQLRAALAAALLALAAGGWATASPTPPGPPVVAAGGTGAPIRPGAPVLRQADSGAPWWCASAQRPRFAVNGTGPEVAELQRYLAVTGDFVVASPTGGSAGSPTGSPTGSYGPATIAAVQRYQCRTMALCEGSIEGSGWGIVGPRTYASICAGTAPASGAASGPAPRAAVAAPRAAVAPGAAAAHWAASAWPPCSDGATVRTVACVDSAGRAVDDGTCTGARPAALAACAPTACAAGGVALAEGASRVFYNASVAVAPDSCAARSQERTCTGARLSGATRFRYASCNDLPRLDAGYSAYRGVFYTPDLRDVQRGDITHGGQIDLADPSFGGVFLRFKWAQFNPANGVYDFAVLDETLRLLARAGKTASLSFAAGKWTPRWVEAAGARMMPYAIADNRRDKYSGDRVPVVWDGTYLAAYRTFMAALARHLRADPELYRAVSLVKITGINVGSAEMRLLQPRVFTQTEAQICKAWAQLGYSDAKVVAAALQLGDAVVSAFPDKKVGLAFVAGSRRYPTVTGGRCDTTGRNRTFEKIITALQSVYGTRLVANSTVLNWKLGDPPLFARLRSLGYEVAYQVGEQYVGCRNDDPPWVPPRNGVADDGQCTRQEFALTLARAKKFRASFLEVFRNDITYFGPMLRRAY